MEFTFKNLLRVVIEAHAQTGSIAKAAQFATLISKWSAL